MPHVKIHQRIEHEIFGKEFPEVESWIDGAYNGKNGRTHWIERHHLEAIYQEAYKRDLNKDEREAWIRAAKLHVLVDWLMYYKRAIIPKNKAEVIWELAKEGIFVE